jgi:hypothetical protein
MQQGNGTMEFGLDGRATGVRELNPAQHFAVIVVILTRCGQRYSGAGRSGAEHENEEKNSPDSPTGH